LSWKILENPTLWKRNNIPFLKSFVHRISSLFHEILCVTQNVDDCVNAWYYYYVYCIKIIIINAKSLYINSYNTIHVIHSLLAVFGSKVCYWCESKGFSKIHFILCLLFFVKLSRYLLIWSNFNPMYLFIRKINEYVDNDNYFYQIL